MAEDTQVEASQSPLTLLDSQSSQPESLIKEADAVQHFIPASKELEIPLVQKTVDQSDIDRWVSFSSSFKVVQPSDVRKLGEKQLRCDIADDSSVASPKRSATVVQDNISEKGECLFSYSTETDLSGCLLYAL